MRARYTAYVLGERDFLLASWHPTTRPQALTLDDATRWLGLRVHEARTMNACTAEVSFTARYREGGAAAVRLQERSLFKREQGHWYYLHAVAPDTAADSSN